MTRLAPLVLALLAAACTRNNAEVFEDLANDARTDSRPDLDRVMTASDAAPLLAGPDALTLPMERGRFPTVYGSVNGVSMPLILDTGTSITVLSGPAARAARIYMPDRPPIGVTSPGYDTPHRLGAFESLSFGDFRFGPSATSVAARERQFAYGILGLKFAIVGSSVLSHFAVTFDYGRREVRLKRHGGEANSSVLLTEVLVNGRPMRLLVDSGANRIVLEPRVAAQLGLVTDEEATAMLGKADRESRAAGHRVTLDSVTFAGKTLEKIPGLVLHTFEDKPGAPAGLLGLGAFGKSVWTLDYAEPRLRLDFADGGE